MAGILTDSGVNREVLTRFAIATQADDAKIRRLLRDNAMPGAVHLTFEREPDYFQGTALGCGEDQTIVASADGRVVCMGRCSWRERWINGRAARVGYLAELRLDAAARGRFTLVRDGYLFFRALQQQDAAEFYFTSISAENDRARRFLERGVRGMPEYSFLAELVTLLVAVPNRPSKANLRIKTATPEHIPEMLRVLNDHGRRHQLAAVWNAESLHGLARHGLPIERFVLAMDDTRVIACGALWDQRAFRQTVIRAYSPALSFARPLANFANHLIGLPRLPAPGSVLAQAFLSPLAFAPEAEAILPDFVQGCFPMAKQIGVDFLALALPATDTRLAVMKRRFSTRSWHSRLYRVNWSGQAASEFRENGGAVLPDVALL